MGEVAEAFLIGGGIAGVVILAGWLFGHFASEAFGEPSLYHMTDDELCAVTLATTVCLLASI